MSLKEILQRAQSELKRKDEIREEVQKEVRRALRLSKQAIFMVHRGRLEEAEVKLREAGEILGGLLHTSRGHPDLIYTGLVDSALQEYAEAALFLSLVGEGRFPDPSEVGVPPAAYILGLADVIGELRRRSLDLIRRGEVEEAEKCLELMETIYVELTSMEDAYLLVPGLRRKCDVARRVIEATRGDVTVELRRRSLEHLMMRLLERE